MGSRMNAKRSAAKSGIDARLFSLLFLRRSGFNLQQESRRRNGLSARNVARPSKWSNPFKVSEFGRAKALALFEAYIGRAIARGALDPAELRGFNLACWCKPDESCHADLLISLAAQRTRS